MPPARVSDFQNDNICAITNKGRLLIFPLNQMPRLNKGKGNKIISISKKEASSPDPEKLKFVQILPARSDLILHCKKHFLKLTPGNQKEYTRLRGYRGKRLPRGYQQVDSIEINPIPTAQP
jgi:topoisomerase-4 subunit A